MLVQEPPRITFQIKQCICHDDKYYFPPAPLVVFFFLKKGVIPFDAFWKQNIKCLKSCIIPFTISKMPIIISNTVILKSKINTSFFHNSFKLPVILLYFIFFFFS